MGFHAFWPLLQTRLFPKSRGFWVGGEKVMQRHARESEFGRRGEYLLSRGASSWLCMKFELPCLQ
jgi:hypothetical protein